MKHLLLTTGAGLAAITAALALALNPLSAQVSEDSARLAPPAAGAEAPGLLGKVADIYMNGTPQLTDALGADHNSAALSETAKAAEEVAKDNLSLRHKLLGLANNPAMSNDLRKEGLATAAKLKDEAGEMTRRAGFAETISGVLDTIDLVSTAAKVGGYIYEGDYTGAKKIFVSEVTKKILVNAPNLAAPGVPGVSLLGTVLGEAVHGNFIEPALEKQEEEARSKEYADRYLNKPWLPVNQVWDEKGVIHTLEPDHYRDKDTGNIRVRSPEEQAAYEAGLRTRWQDAQQWGTIIGDLAAGKIDQSRYDELQKKYANRDPSKPWDPNAASLFGVARFAGSYSGRFAGGGAGSVHFTISGDRVTGTISGTCSKAPCEGDPVSGSFTGSVTDLGILRTKLTGHFNIEDKLIGPLGFAGTFNGMVERSGGSGDWMGHNKYGTPQGTWSATRQ